MANEEKDILLSVGIDISSLNEARQQIIAAFTGMTIPVSMAPAAQVRQDAQRIRREVETDLAGQPITIKTEITQPAAGAGGRGKGKGLLGLDEAKEDAEELDATYKKILQDKEEADHKARVATSKGEAERVAEIKNSEAQITKAAVKRVEEIESINKKGQIAEANFRASQYKREGKEERANLERLAKERTKLEKEQADQRVKDIGTEMQAETKLQKDAANNSWNNFIKKQNEAASLKQKNSEALAKIDEQFATKQYSDTAKRIETEEALRTKLARNVHKTQESLKDLEVSKYGKLTAGDQTKINQYQKELVSLGLIKGKSLEVLGADLKQVEAIRLKQAELVRAIRLREAEARAARQPVERGLAETAGHIFSRAILWSSVFTIAYGGIRTLQNAAGEVVRQFLDIDEAVVILKRDLNVAEEDMSKVLGVALNAAETQAFAYGKTIKDVILVQDKFAKQGLSLSDILKATEATLIGSATAMTTTAEAAQILSTTMLTFGVSASETITIFDKLNEVSKKFNITAKDLGTALQHTGGAAQQAGLTLDTTLGLITVIAEATGRAGAEIGNALRTMSSFVYRPDTVKGLADVGVAVLNADRSFRTMDEIIGTLARRWDILTDAEQQNVVQLLAGTLRREQLLAIMNNYPRYLSASAVSAGSFTSALDEMSDVMDTVTFHGQQLRSAIGELSVSFQELGSSRHINAFLDSISLVMRNLALSMRGVIPEIRELLGVMAAASDEFREKSTDLWKPVTPEIQTLLFVQQILRNNAKFSTDQAQATIAQVDKLRGLSDAQFEMLSKSATSGDTFRKTLVDIAKELGPAVISTMGSAIQDQQSLNLELTAYLSNLKHLREIGKDAYADPQYNETVKRELASLAKRLLTLNIFRKERIELERVIEQGLSPANLKVVDAAIEGMYNTLEQGGIITQDSIRTLIALEVAQRTVGDSIKDIKPKIEFTSKAIDAYNRKIKEAKDISEQTRDLSKSAFTIRQDYIKTLLGDTDAKIIGLKAELDALDRAKKEDLGRTIDTDKEKVQREGITAAIAEATRHQAELNGLSLDAQGILFDLQSNTDLLIAKSKPLENIFGDKLQHNLDTSQAALSVVEGQLKKIQTITDIGVLTSEEDARLLSQENDLLNRRLDLEIAIQDIKGKQFEESLRMRQLVLGGLTQEQALMQEINRLAVGKELDPAIEKAKELIDYQFSKAERMVESISDGISTGLVDAMTAAPGESDDAFRNMFKSIFTELFQDDLKNQLKSLIGKSQLVSEGDIVANAIRTAMEQGGIAAANAMSIAMGRGPLDYTPGTGSTGGTGTGGTGLSSKFAVGSMFALSALSSYSNSQKAEIENAWAPLIGTIIGGIVGTMAGGNTMTGMAVGGALGGLFVKQKKAPEAIEVKDPAIETLHRDLEFVNRNLIALRKPLELFALPASYYFSQKPGFGVQVQGVVINIGSTDSGPDAITAAVADGMLSASKKLYQGV